jgi:hypothetical protein
MAAARKRVAVAGPARALRLPPAVINVGLARIEGAGDPVHNRVH